MGRRKWECIMVCLLVIGCFVCTPVVFGQTKLNYSTFFPAPH